LDYIQQIKLDFCTISLRNDGVIENRFLMDTPYEIDADSLEKIANAMTVLSRGNKMPILSIAGLYGTISPEARKVDINDANNYTLALALVIRELHQRLLAIFYFKLKKIDYPVKTFKNEVEALEWLNHQVRLNKKVG